jgi:hypothetical protein
MKKYILNYVKDKEHEFLGLMIENVTHHKVTAANEGMTVAHDLIEHNGLDSIGGVFNEIEALGALWYVRGYFNDINRINSGPYSPYEVVTSELFMCFEHYLYNGDSDDKPNIARTRCCEYDEDFELITSMLKKQINKNDFDREQRIAGQYFLTTVLPHLRKGYRQCKRRFRHLSQCRVNTLFWNIAKAMDEVLPLLEYEGQQVILRYCLTTTEANAEIIEPNWW